MASVEDEKMNRSLGSETTRSRGGRSRSSRDRNPKLSEGRRRNRIRVSSEELLETNEVSDGRGLEDRRYLESSKSSQRRERDSQRASRLVRDHEDEKSLSSLSCSVRNEDKDKRDQADEQSGGSSSRQSIRLVYRDECSERSRDYQSSGDDRSWGSLYRHTVTEWQGEVRSSRADGQDTSKLKSSLDNERASEHRKNVVDGCRSSTGEDSQSSRHGRTNNRRSRELHRNSTRRPDERKLLVERRSRSSRDLRSPRDDDIKRAARSRGRLIRSSSPTRHDKEPSEENTLRTEKTSFGSSSSYRETGRRMPSSESPGNSRASDHGWGSLSSRGSRDPKEASTANDAKPPRISSRGESYHSSKEGVLCEERRQRFNDDDPSIRHQLDSRTSLGKETRSCARHQLDETSKREESEASFRESAASSGSRASGSREYADSSARFMSSDEFGSSGSRSSERASSRASRSKEKFSFSPASRASTPGNTARSAWACQAKGIDHEGVTTGKVAPVGNGGTSERLQRDLLEEEICLEQARVLHHEDKLRREEEEELRRQQKLEYELQHEKTEQLRRQKEEEAQDRREEERRLELLRIQEEEILREEFGDDPFDTLIVDRNVDHPIEEELYNSDVEGEKARKRREFWGSAQSDCVGSDTASTQGDLTMHDHIIGTSIQISPGNAAMFSHFDQELRDTNLHPFVLRVLKLMFSSLAVVFRNTIVNPEGDAKPFSFRRIPSIPSRAARMLWNELLGEVKYYKDCETGEYRMERPPDGFNARWDHSLTRETIVAFSQWVNGEEVAGLPQRRGLLGRLQPKKGNPPPGGQSKRNSGNRGFLGIGKPKEQGTVTQKMLEESEQDPTRIMKDPFMVKVRDYLVKSGFVEIAGRLVDDDDEEVTAITHDETVSEEEPPSHSDDLGLSNMEPADFSAWKGKSTRESRSQYLQIYKDMQHQYGVYLSSLPVRDGGYACLEVKDEDVDTQTGSIAMREWDTMKRWNDCMSRACIRKLVDQGVFLHRSRRWTENSQASAKSIENPYDDAASYALRMYPSHLMRSGKVAEAARMLQNSLYFRARVAAFGCFESANRHRADLSELERRVNLAHEGLSHWGGDGHGIDAEDIITSSVPAMIQVMSSQYPITHPEDSPVVAEVGVVEGEREPGDVGRALHLIGTFLAERGDSAGAMDGYEEALKYKIAAMGRDHTSVGRTYRHMGHVHLNEYEYQDAVQCYAESVRIERLQDDMDFKRIILALNSMGMIHGMTGKHEDAIDAYAQSLLIQKANLGETHPQVAETLNSMGIVYGMMGVFNKAVECYSEALFIKIRKLGPDHEDVADVHFNLGLVHNKRGDHDSAINCYQEALRIRKERLGEEDEEVARVLHHIGVVLSDMGEVGDAMRFYEECLRIRRLILGEDHEDVARTLHNLGLVHYDSGNYDKSLECLEDALKLGRQKLGKRSEKVADTLHSMGLVYQKLASFDEAIEHYEEAAQIRRSKLGTRHLEVGGTLHNMGDVFYMMGDLERAMDAYMEAFEIRLDRLGDKDVDVAATRNNMGVVYMKKGDHEAAMECFEAALRIREMNLGIDHEKCSDTLHNMGLVHKNLMEYESAIERYEQALRIRKVQLGDGDMKVADTLYNMAIVHANTGKYADALERYKEALRTYRETGMTDEHPSIVNTLQWIKWAQKKLAKANRRSRSGLHYSSSDELVVR